MYIIYRYDRRVKVCFGEAIKIFGRRREQFVGILSLFSIGGHPGDDEMVRWGGSEDEFGRNPEKAVTSPREAISPGLIYLPRNFILALSICIVGVSRPDSRPCCILYGETSFTGTYADGKTWETVMGYSRNSGTILKDR